MIDDTGAAYRAFDPETALRLRALDAARETRAGQLLIEEGLANLRAANERVVEDYDLRAGFQASGEQNWRIAPAVAELSAILAKVYGVQPRSPGHSFFVNETLAGKRVWSVGTPSAGGYLVHDRATSIGEQAGSNSFLPLCSVVGPAFGGNQNVAQWDALPVVTVLANETAQAADASLTVTGARIGPINLGTYLEASKPWVLQAVGGAESIQRTARAALRTTAQVQIIEGSDSGGEAKGLVNDSNVPGTAGTSVAWAGICTAMQAVEDGAGDGELAWVVTAPAATILRQREKAAGSGVILDDGRIGGYRCIVVGGTSSAHAVFGKWSDLLIIEWSPLELAVNPFAVFRASLVGIRGWFTFNFAPSLYSSFYSIKSIT